MTLAEKTLEVSRRYLAVREDPPGSNRGPMVDLFIREGGGLEPEDHHWPYCASYASFCVLLAFHEGGLGDGNSGPLQFSRGASGYKLIERNPHLILSGPQAKCIGVILHPDNSSHVILVDLLLPDSRILSVEANTGPGPSAPATDRDGQGVFERHERKVSDITKFIRIG